MSDKHPNSVTPKTDNALNLIMGKTAEAEEQGPVAMDQEFRKPFPGIKSTDYDRGLGYTKKR